MLTLTEPLPSGWHEIRGDSGRTATMWSLARFRPRGRTTLIVQCAEPYDYAQVAQWCNFQPEEILIVEASQDVLEIVTNLCQSGEIGQVIFEGLGFLMGSGKLLPEVESFLGDITLFFRLTSLAQEKDIAFYIGGQNINDFLAPVGVPKERSLGGRLLLELCAEKQLNLKRECFLTRYGQRSGERYSVTNQLTEEIQHFDLKYDQGPIRPK